MTIQVFIDSNIYVSAVEDIAKDADFQFLCKIREMGQITVLITEIVFEEVKKHRFLNEWGRLKPLFAPDACHAYKRLTGNSLFSDKKSNLKIKVKENCNAKFAEFCKSKLKVQWLDGSEISPNLIFSAYAKGEGFFGREAKKNQFPDAFNFEAIKVVATAQKPVIIVSTDEDFDNAYVRACPYIKLVKSLSDLIKELGSQEV